MNNTLSNGLDLLLHLANSARDHALSDLARDLELPKSHIHRLLQTLVASQYVEQSDNRRYRIGVGALRLGRSLLVNIPIRTIAMPILTKAVQSIQKPLTLAIPFGHQAISIAFASHDGQLRDSITTLGTVLPAHSSACGKLFLAHLREDQRDLILKELEYTKRGPNTHSDSQSLLTDLQTIVRDNHSINNQENGDGVLSVATAIRDSDNNIIAAFGISEYAESGHQQILQDMLKYLHVTAQEIETAIQEQLCPQTLRSATCQ